MVDKEEEIMNQAIAIHGMMEILSISLGVMDDELYQEKIPYAFDQSREICLKMENLVQRLMECGCQS